ncbi:MAG: hypothetical protein LUB60_00730 [Clostridiales bacterium]|nr:hypothetical protein [Clostridiales bacterium]
MTECICSRYRSNGTDYYWVDTDNFFVGEYRNDSSRDLIFNYPDYLTGKVGYIVEIE